MNQLRMLISLHRGYGLGDAVQMSSVLRHVAAAHPNWTIDYQAEEGKHQVGRGIVANHFAYGQPYPSDYYDGEVQIVLYETWQGFTDRPNTRVSSCLRDHFALPWNPEYGRYEVQVSRDAAYAAQGMLSLVIARRHKLSTRPVVVHYQGITIPEKKDLTDQQAMYVCGAIHDLDRLPLLLDWQNKSRIPHIQKLFEVGTVGGTVPSWGSSAEMNCAVISQCEAFVGIDSGPGKCASATDTPSLIVWTGHHPAQFHDPAPNTTHLVPINYHSMDPVRNNPEVVRWFARHYNIRYYEGDPVGTIKQWLKEVLL